MSLVVTPESAAADAEAFLVEYAVKIPTSISDNLSTSFNHRAMVHGATGL